jgi:hypothetical protein
MRAIEAKTERSSLELVRMGNVGALSLDQLGAIAAELIRAGAEDEIPCEKTGDGRYTPHVPRVCP